MNRIKAKTAYATTRPVRFYSSLNYGPRFDRHPTLSGQQVDIRPGVCVCLGHGEPSEGEAGIMTSLIGGRPAFALVSPLDLRPLAEGEAPVWP